MPLDLLVPHLLLPADAPGALRDVRLPALEKWFARGDEQDGDAVSAEAWLAAEHGYRERAPYAALGAASELRESGGGEWLRADPVHLRIDRDDLRLESAAVAPPTMDEARALAAALQAHFHEDGLELRVVAPDRWYARVPRGESPTKTTPLAQALGKNIFGLLPEGKGRIRWRSAITESQMVLAAHALNEERERRGLPAINSVWFWGEGTIANAPPRRYRSVHAADPIARGLGALTGAQVRDAPAGAGDIDAAHGDDAALAVIDAMTGPFLSGDAHAWRAAALRLDADWFARIPELLERRGAVRIILPSARGARISTITPASRWRLLRRGRPVMAHG